MEHRFEAGTQVMYGATGLCTVDGVREMQMPYDDDPQNYYVLRPCHTSRSVIYVPLCNQKLLDRMRPVLSKAEIDSLLLGSGGRAMEWPEDRMYRNSRFHEVLGNGNQTEILEMLRCLYLKRQELQQRGKKLNGADDAVLKAAEKMVQDEFSLSLAIDPSEVGGYIRSHLGLS